MNSQEFRFDNTNLNAELFYSAFLSLPEAEKEFFLTRLLNSINSKAISFTSKGKALTKKQYSQHIEAISKDVKNGNFISHEDMLNEAENE
ncbi:MAG: hypothetical protein WCK02_04350 [Bacteroidota bacterium]